MILADGGTARRDARARRTIRDFSTSRRELSLMSRDRRGRWSGTGLANAERNEELAAKRVRISNDSKQYDGLEPERQRLYYVPPTRLTVGCPKAATP
jgi:hypothetical protein